MIAALVLAAADLLVRTGRTVLLPAALFAPSLGYGLYQALAVYGPGLAHAAARLL